KLQRSVIEIRKSCSGRARVSASSPVGASRCAGTIGIRFRYRWSASGMIFSVMAGGRLQAYIVSVSRRHCRTRIAVLPEKKAISQGEDAVLSLKFNDEVWGYVVERNV